MYFCVLAITGNNGIPAKRICVNLGSLFLHFFNIMKRLYTCLFFSLARAALCCDAFFLVDACTQLGLIHSPDRGGIQGAPQHLAHAGQPEELPANSPPQAKILRKNRYVFNFFIQTLILI